ncbi:MAG: hypothetical protein QW103_00635 [Candidatus Pacearchaeota archaeon]
MNEKIKELKIRILKEKNKRSFIRKEIARKLLTKNKEVKEKN